MTREIKGWHVLSAFVLAFGVIISVNLTLAFNAVKTFPGLEVRNSYVSSQSFEADRAAQLALGWDVSANVSGDMLTLLVLKDGHAIAPTVESATFGRATSVSQDQTPHLIFDGTGFHAPVTVTPGNWNLRLKMRAADGTLFQQRVVVRIAS